MRFILIPLLALLALSCSEPKPRYGEIEDYLPEDASHLIRIRNLNAFKTAKKNNPGIARWLPSEFLESGAHSLIGQLFAEEPAYLGLKEEDYLLLIDQGGDSLMASEGNFSVESLVYDRNTYGRIRIDSLEAYRYKDSTLSVYSSSLPWLRKVLEEPATTPSPWKSLLAATNGSRLLSLVRRSESEPFPRPGVSNYPDHQMVTDVELEPDALKAFGIGSAKDSSALLFPFRSNPLPMQTPSMAPGSSVKVKSIAMSDLSLAWDGQHPEAAADSLINEAYELGYSAGPEGALLYLHTYAPQATADFLAPRSKASETYQEKEIRSLNQPEALEPLMDTLDETGSPAFYIVLDQTLVFAEQAGSLKDYLSSHSLQQTFDKTTAFKTIEGSLADASHFLLIEREGEKEQVKALQLTNDQESIHSAYYQGLAIGDPQLAGTRKIMELQLEQPALTNPKFVLNHYSGKQEVVVQDQGQELYRFGTSGQLLWKKVLPGFISGTLHEVDLYHNKKWQLAYVAGNRFQVLDRNGKLVKPFDMKFQPSASMLPLAVFDYDNDKDYRFVLTYDDKIEMYNRRGQQVKGFTYHKAKASLMAAPVHIRMENRDYLVFRLEDGTLKILNRVGRERVPVAQKFEFASEVFGHDNHFVFTTATGMQYRIDRRGSIKEEIKGLEPDHGFTASPVRKVILNGNVLRIGTAQATLDYGVYTAPQLFYRNKKSYVAVTDLQSHQTYLFDSTAKLLPGFPVYGNSEVDLEDMNKDGSLELVVAGTDNNILLYSIQ